MKKYLLLFTLVAIAQLSYSQEQDPAPAPEKGGGFDKSRLFFGGSFGLNFGNYTLVNVSPQLGYRFNPHLAAGAGVNFIYSSIKNKYSNGEELRQNQGVSGLNIFGRVYPIEQILLQVQPEINYTWGKVKETAPGFSNTYNLESRFVPSLLLGAGAAIPAGRGAFVVMAQYDVLQDARTPYGDKIFFNFGFNVGF